MGITVIIAVLKSPPLLSYIVGYLNGIAGCSEETSSGEAHGI